MEFAPSPMDRLYTGVVSSYTMLRIAGVVADLVAVQGYELDEAIEETGEHERRNFVRPAGVAAEQVEAARQAHELLVATALDMARAAVTRSGASEACTALEAAAGAAYEREQQVRRLVDRERGAAEADLYDA
ncbi:hypothetical protein ABZ135_23415 [Streptomyces sp. NPDC006339]|uniref:hypothetical protein n=1 Tax=Streptomyces sp. NPDC006339 TaxID=3156755 RepID=UPI0033A2ED03